MNILNILKKGIQGLVLPAQDLLPSWRIADEAKAKKLKNLSKEKIQELILLALCPFPIRYSEKKAEKLRRYNSFMGLWIRNEKAGMFQTDARSDIGQMIHTVRSEYEESIGKFNVIIAGRTGVAKNVLIDSIFRGKVATTGCREPITEEITKISKEGVPLTVFDTNGLEKTDPHSIRKELLDLVQEGKKGEDVKKNIHAGWLCIDEDLQRVEQAEIDFCEALAEYMPVIVVIMKSCGDGEFYKKVKKLLSKARAVVCLGCIDEKFVEGNEVRLQKSGLKQLSQATYNLIPEAMERAFIAAQKVSNKKMRQSSEGIVAASAKGVNIGGMEFVFRGDIVLLPVQTRMLVGISRAFGLRVSDEFLTLLLATAKENLSDGFVDTSLLSNRFYFDMHRLRRWKMPPFDTEEMIEKEKMIAVAGKTAVDVTTAIGECYIDALVAIFSLYRGEDEPSQEDILKEFKNRLENKERRGPIVPDFR